MDDIPLAGTIASNETDSNADTCCLGTNFVIMNYTSRMADVFPYDSSYAPLKNVPIVTGATAWDDPITKATYILVFHESLYYGTKLNHSLLNPNQIRQNHGIGYWDNPFDPLHDLAIKTDDVQIPLSQFGTKIEFSSRAPTDAEMNNCTHIQMTDQFPRDPETVRFNIAEARITAKEPLKRFVCSTTTWIPTDNPYGDIE